MHMCDIDTHLITYRGMHRYVYTPLSSFLFCHVMLSTVSGIRVCTGLLPGYTKPNGKMTLLWDKRVNCLLAIFSGL